ncbi:MAG: hypothetical protein OEW87_04440 [Flavobacteriaceae bacterium]|nr:hypothetical protein [Flavobacteriaceae bacterium]
MEEFGKLAKSTLGEEFKLQILHSNAGFYIGTKNEDGTPVSRESEEYFQDKEQATEALKSGEWTQRPDITS